MKRTVVKPALNVDQGGDVGEWRSAHLRHLLDQLCTWRVRTPTQGSPGARGTCAAPRPDHSSADAQAHRTTEKQ